MGRRKVRKGDGIDVIWGVQAVLRACDPQETGVQTETTTNREKQKEQGWRKPTVHSAIGPISVMDTVGQ